MRIRAMSPLQRFRKVPSYSPHRLLARVQCFRKDLYNAVEGPNIRHIVLSMINGSFFRRRRRLSHNVFSFIVFDVQTKEYLQSCYNSLCYQYCILLFVDLCVANMCFVIIKSVS